jgi:hypothetical protein
MLEYEVNERDDYQILESNDLGFACEGVIPQSDRLGVTVAEFCLSFASGCRLLHSVFMSSNTTAVSTT